MVSGGVFVESIRIDAQETDMIDMRRAIWGFFIIAGGCMEWWIIYLSFYFGGD